MMKRGVVLFVLSLVLSVPGGVQAQEEIDKGRADFTMEEVVVTATRPKRSGKTCQTP